MTTYLSIFTDTKSCIQKCEICFEMGYLLLLLSTSLPQTDELDNALEGASFQLVRRSGFMASDRVETPLKKKTQYALSAGSVLQNRYQGALYDVGLSDVHPVYRYSKPIFMGVTL